METPSTCLLYPAPLAVGADQMGIGNLGSRQGPAVVAVGMYLLPGRGSEGCQEGESGHHTTLPPLYGPIAQSHGLQFQVCPRALSLQVDLT